MFLLSEPPECGDWSPVPSRRAASSSCAATVAPASHSETPLQQGGWSRLLRSKLMRKKKEKGSKVMVLIYSPWLPWDWSFTILVVSVWSSKSLCETCSLGRTLCDVSFSSTPLSNSNLLIFSWRFLRADKMAVWCRHEMVEHYSRTWLELYHSIHARFGKVVTDWHLLARRRWRVMMWRKE